MDEEALIARADRDIRPLLGPLCYMLGVDSATQDRVRESLLAVWRQGYEFAHEENTVKLRRTDPGFPKVDPRR